MRVEKYGPGSMAAFLEIIWAIEYLPLNPFDNSCIIMQSSAQSFYSYFIRTQ